jgi:peptidoglycan/LPS O-acetylase OafA/YrhL
MLIDQPQHRTFSGLEVCRVLSALAVIIWHYQHFFSAGILTAPVPHTERIHFPLYSALHLFYNQGGFAVPIFWAISGFIFFWKYGESIHARKTNVSAFFMLRCSRLYPLHFATLLLVALLQTLYVRSHGVPFVFGHNDIFHFVLQLLFVSNWLNREPWTFNGPVWSVSVEIVVYMGFFGLVRLIRPSVIQCVLAIGLAKLLMHFQMNNAIIHCVYFFFAGGLRQRIDHNVRPGHRKYAFLLSAAIAIVLVALLKIHLLFINQTLELLLAASIVNTFVLIDNFAPVFNRVSWVGNLTYSSYLIHFPIQLSLALGFDALGVPRTVFLSPVMFLIFLALTFTFARLVYNVYEVRMQSLIRSWWFARESAVPNASPPMRLDQRQ